MTSFINPQLLWIGLPLVALPIVIHLINLVRHRRVQWAAMEFLLASQRKNSSWVRLKELLLLLLRMAAILAVVLMLAQPMLRNEIGRLLGNTRTHHIVLLDDSYSMSDRWSDTSAFDQARAAISRIGQQAAQQSSPQVFTLLRFSSAAKSPARMPANGDAEANKKQIAEEALFLEERVDTEFDEQLDAVLADLQPSQLAVGPDLAIAAIQRALSAEDDENRIVYIMSDFRAREWSNPGDLKTGLALLEQSVTELNLIGCVDQARGNLAVLSLVPERGTRAAGVPLFMELTLKNFGSERARNVAVAIQEDNAARTLVHDEIAPGAEETVRFPVFFPVAGEHRVTVSLPPDAVLADNTRYHVLTLPKTVPVLIVDGDAAAPDGQFLTIPFAPGGSVQTGISPQIESPAFLNNQPLEKFQCIYLANVGRLDPPAITALENFVAAGGGLAIFVGPNTTSAFYNDKLYRDGEGFFPLPLLAETRLLVDRLEPAPDLEVVDHPVFRIFAGERNTFLSSVIVERFYASPKTWEPLPDSSVQVIARLRNGSPLVVEKTFGKGRVLAVLTTAGPRWNNWGRNPSFVVALLEFQAHLASSQSTPPDQLAGAPFTLSFDAARYKPEVKFAPPTGSNAAGGAPVARRASQTSTGLQVTFNETESSGIYEARLLTPSDATESRQFAVNVDPAEGDLAVTGSEELAERLEGVSYQFRLADDVQVAPRELAGANMSQWILFALVAMLVAEQALAYSTSYHPRRLETAR